MMDCIVEHSMQYGLHINVNKTKLVVFSKTPGKTVLRINNKVVEQVSSIKYLGALVNDACDPKTEILAKIEQARRTFTSMKTLFSSRDLSLELRIRMLRSYIFPVFLYGSESWTLNQTLENRINAFEMYLYRRMLRISWMDRVTNEEVLRPMGKDKELLSTVKERKLQYVGHTMRGDRYEVLRLVIEGKIEGRRSVGRRQNSWLKDLRRWFGRTSIEIFRGAVSRTIIASWIANLRRETAA